MARSCFARPLSPRTDMKMPHAEGRSKKATPGSAPAVTALMKLKQGRFTIPNAVDGVQAAAGGEPTTRHGQHGRSHGQPRDPGHRGRPSAGGGLNTSVSMAFSSSDRSPGPPSP